MGKSTGLGHEGCDEWIQASKMGGKVVSQHEKITGDFMISVSSASKISIRRFVITEKAPTRAFSWLKLATTAFTCKTLLRHYAKWALTPRSLNVKLGRDAKVIRQAGRLA